MGETLLFAGFKKRRALSQCNLSLERRNLDKMGGTKCLRRKPALSSSVGDWSGDGLSLPVVANLGSNLSPYGMGIVSY